MKKECKCENIKNWEDEHILWVKRDRKREWMKDIKKDDENRNRKNRKARKNKEKKFHRMKMMMMIIMRECNPGINVELYVLYWW